MPCDEPWFTSQIQGWYDNKPKSTIEPHFNEVKGNNKNDTQRMKGKLLCYSRVNRQQNSQVKCLSAFITDFLGTGGAQSWGDH